eukprot:TRINITY_DN3612_c0_g1_i6.p1 TRINITY_DN3612_c0_g1~~TRINITY_DN3612_c0_g1_i6.p1  ORF type:complete len:504 (-),score=64.58 TRINITY_DN3612_c0_g1_i6:27-1538(-)
MQNLGFTAKDKTSVWRILAGILHLGNVEFKEGKEERTESSLVSNTDQAKLVARLLCVDDALLCKALTSRAISTGAGARGRESKIHVFLSKKQAYDTANSLAKALYNSLFSLVVETLNRSIQLGDKKADSVIGVLDIYGFEIFEHNSFEQFCINYCNEKLQQLFIYLVLKSEQEEYEREGIEWKQIDYFDNAPIVELIEGKTGIIALLDEAGLVGTATTKEVMDKLDAHLKGKPQYNSYEASGHKKEYKQNMFRIKHYAGDVDYEVEEFLPKNRDTLYRDATLLLQSSTDDMIKHFFPYESEEGSKKSRPPTAGTQFRANVADLITKLRSCQPHYIRCIKSNDVKKAFNFDEERVKHQTRYLNLVETVRVRRAGFCNRQPYARFLHRYKMISKQTWPFWKGSDPDGVQCVLDDSKIPKEEYRRGKTKVFIRNAATLFKLEELRADFMPKVAILVQRHIRGYLQRRRFRKMMLALWFQKHLRGYQEIGRAVQQECRDRSRMPSSA